ncbi:MAG TPA: cohesin domain-containing protein [Candidatus Paceibacterota bacterium]|nr:cohesin domain-containing protein [Candidatus Paceibacterota bacterium]
MHKCRSIYRTVRITKVICVIALAVFGISTIAEAASLSVVPVSTQVAVGNIVQVKIVIGTNNKAINNAEGVIQYPTDLLEVQSVSKNPSVFTLWVEEPFANGNGTISFNGGIPNPGYTGEGGNVASIIFKAKKSGTASILISEGAVRENDGLGTDILAQKIAGVINIQAPTEPVVEPVTEPQVPISGVPALPVITSTTHPNQNKWYNSGTAELAWAMPSDVTTVSTLLGRTTGNPSVLYDPPIKSKKFDNLEDGQWYFGLKFKNSKGWSQVRNYKILVDTAGPNPFKISFVKGEFESDPRPIAKFEATDKLSGISDYEIKIDDGEFIKISHKEHVSGAYKLPAQDPGEHTLLVKAIDGAGNETVQTAQFTIGSIDMPIIEDYTSVVRSGELLRVSGTSHSNSNVEVVLEDSKGNRKNQIVNTLSDGRFILVWDEEINRGTYTLTARAIDERGAKSFFTEPYYVTVKSPLFSSISGMILNWLSLALIVVMSLGLIVLMVVYFMFQIKRFKKSLNQQVHNTESSVHKAFESLRENVRSQIKNLENVRTKRDLTKEEKKIIVELQKNITVSEEHLQKQLSDLEETISK